jgi:transcriptional antiterminator RfaH
MNQNQSSLHWYAVRTKPRQEALALENLLRQDYETYLPMIELRKRRRNKWVEVVEPLFPCYAFVHLDPDATDIAPIRSTLGVTGMVKFGNILTPVPDHVIGFLKKTEDEATGLHHSDKPLFKKGEKVDIMEGPFAGLAGVYQIEKGEDRAMILIELLGRQNKVAVKLDAISRQ